jgi:hypothetical protein
MRTDVKNSRGQATVILGMAAAVVDAGARHSAHPRPQNDADAAALAGATARPESPSGRSIPLGD